jgi:hypothetical protein
MRIQILILFYLDADLDLACHPDAPKVMLIRIHKLGYFGSYIGMFYDLLVNSTYNLISSARTHPAVQTRVADAHSFHPDPDPAF